MKSWKRRGSSVAPDFGPRADSNHLADLIQVRLSRRQALGGGLSLAAAGFFGQTILGSAAAKASGPGLPGGNGSLLGFVPIPTSTDDAVHVPEGYIAEILIPWGTPLFAGAPAWKKDATNTAAETEKQVGFNHDGMHYFPLVINPDGSQSGLLCINHEYTDANQIYSAAQGSVITNDAAGREKVAKAMALVGVTVVEIHKSPDGHWSHVQGSPYNRRITATTPVNFSGPVKADHPLIKSQLGNAPAGTLNNCAMGHTPWGTYLTCEENFNDFFGSDDASVTPTPAETRYGISRTASTYNWHKAEPRWDLAKNRNEANRFGWVVEIDPHDPTSTPVKRTALGRVKHEGATVTEHADRIVVYTGDDENGNYLYRFVGNAPWRQVASQGKSPLDEGTLYVAQFNVDGTGTWLPLVHGSGALTTANGWVDQADVLIRTRLAGDAVGATKLHRPEWIAKNDYTGDVFVTLTNGSGNNAPVNSGRDPNPYGHIVRFRDVGFGDVQSTFVWDVFLFAGDPMYPEGAHVPADQPLFGSPDGLATDPDGRVWIATDISNSSQNLASRGYDRIGNNQVLVADPGSGEVRRFLTGPRGCEITGVMIAPDQRSVFLAVQHPGESSSFWNTLNGAPPSTDNPRAVSNWPDFDPAGRPRSATVVVRRLDGGIVGS